MSEQNEQIGTANGDSADADDTVRALMNLAGPRAEIPADLERRVHDKVLATWQQATVRPNRLKWAIPAALAASVLVAVMMSGQAPDAPVPQVGTVASVVGTPDFEGQAYTLGDVVPAGRTLATGRNEGLAIAMADGVSLRVGPESSVRIDSVDEVRLLSGGVYADSGDRVYRMRHIAIVTPQGTATDVGTQFSVRYLGDATRVAVREGRVDFNADDAVHVAVAGNQLLVGENGDAQMSQIDAFDPAWHWTEDLAPRFDANDKSLLDFLKWVSRETGKELVFSSSEVRMAAMSTRLFGPVSDFAPAEAVEAVLATTQFVYRIDERSITISR